MENSDRLGAESVYKPLEPIHRSLPQIRVEEIPSTGSTCRIRRRFEPLSRECRKNPGRYPRAPPSCARCFTCLCDASRHRFPRDRSRARCPGPGWPARLARYLPLHLPRVADAPLLFLSGIFLELLISRDGVAQTFKGRLKKSATFPSRAAMFIHPDRCLFQDGLYGSWPGARIDPSFSMIF